MAMCRDDLEREAFRSDAKERTIATDCVNIEEDAQQLITYVIQINNDHRE